MRKPRELLPRYSYHVVARINRSEMLFTTGNSYKELFLKHISKARKKYTFVLRNICIMGNHVHLQIKPTGTSSLSRIMQYILGNFAREYNRLNKLKGHVWYDRFKSKIIFTLREYIRTFFYIANNPVRTLLVEHPLEYKYNGITAINFATRTGKPPGHYNLKTLGKLIERPGLLLLKKLDAFIMDFSKEKALSECSDIGFR